MFFQIFNVVMLTLMVIVGAIAAYSALRLIYAGVMILVHPLYGDD